MNKSKTRRGEEELVAGMCVNPHKPTRILGHRYFQGEGKCKWGKEKIPLY